jgi:hypothetical protein
MLSNVIIKAPSIKIASNFEGNAQFIASDSIVVEEHVRLKFPSALVVESSNPNSLHLIRIGAGSEIQGLIQINSNPLDYEKNICLIAENCTITGEILINGTLSLKNLTLNGKVITYKTITTLGNFSYYNTLVDSKIDGEILEKSSLFVKGANPKTMLYVD